MKSKTGYGEAQRWLADHVGYDEDDCLWWPFSSGRTNQKKLRPIIQYQGRTHGVARLICQLRHGEPPTPDHESAHSCGKGHLGCVNPKHLRWATAQENTDDKITHGTMLRGSQMHASKLTDQKVMEMRRLYTSGKEHTSNLPKMFGVNPSTAWNVVARKTWAHVPDAPVYQRCSAFIR